MLFTDFFRSDGQGKKIRQIKNVEPGVEVQDLWVPSAQKQAANGDVMLPTTCRKRKKR